MSALGQKRTFWRCGSHVRFTPNSGHLQCTSSCPLCANSGHVTLQFDCAERRLTDGRTASMSIGKQRRLKRVVELINSKSWLFTFVTGAVQAGVWNLLPGTAPGAALVTPGAAPFSPAILTCWSSTSYDSWLKSHNPCCPLWVKSGHCSAQADR